MQDPQSVAAAIDAWTSGLGTQAVISDAEGLGRYTQSVCSSERVVFAVLKPSSLEQVQAIVEVANEFRVPLYPISTGKQWGMGSRLPVRDGAAVVDLSRMNRIIEVNVQHNYAVVEPGVTQRQLFDYIEEHDLPLMLNVTGSTSDTSLIGNAMDRGVGYFKPRADGISNFTVVLGNGETIRTGFGHIDGAKTKNLYPYGIGPDLSGLFPQGNFGVVTSACIDLMPEPEDHMAAIIKISDENDLPKLIDALVSLRSRGVVNTIAHIGSRERSYSTLAPLLYDQLVLAGNPRGEATRFLALDMLKVAGFGPWSTSLGVLGTRAQLKLAKKEIRKAVGGFAKTMFLNDAFVDRAKAVASKLMFIPAVRTQLMLLKAVEPIYRLTCCETTDVALKCFYWSAEDFQHLDELDPDQSNCGLLFCVAIIPACGEAVREAVRCTREVFARHGFDAGITVNLINAKAVEGVVSLSFDRRDEALSTKAHECIREMEEKYVAMGYPPYRVGINSMEQTVQESDPFWRTVRDLKKVLDPNNIIAPGRYNLV